MINLTDSAIRRLNNWGLMSIRELFKISVQIIARTTSLFVSSVSSVSDNKKCRSYGLRILPCVSVAWDFRAELPCYSNFSSQAFYDCVQSDQALEWEQA